MTDTLFALAIILALVAVLFGGLFAIVGGIALASAPAALYGSLAFVAGACTLFAIL